jgi:hypothetical protein
VATPAIPTGKKLSEPLRMPLCCSWLMASIGSSSVCCYCPKLLKCCYCPKLLQQGMLLAWQQSQCHWPLATTRLTSLVHVMQDKHTLLLKMRSQIPTLQK